MPKFTAIMSRVVKETYETTVFAKDKLEALDIIDSEYSSCVNEWKTGSANHVWERQDPSYADYWQVSKASPEKIEISILEMDVSMYTPSVVIDGIEMVQVSSDGEEEWKARTHFVRLSDEFVIYDNDVSARVAACEYVMDRGNPNWWKRYAS